VPPATVWGVAFFMGCCFPFTALLFGHPESTGTASSNRDLTGVLEGLRWQKQMPVPKLN
jgi:hypothetical protein